MLKVLGYPYCSDHSSASARLRFHNRLASIQDLVSLKVYEPGDNLKDFDLFYLQKRVGPDTLDLARHSPISVVFDIDDSLGTAASVHLDIEMLNLADQIIVDTPAKKELFDTLTQVPITVIPDGIDYFTEPVELSFPSEIKTCCAFGADHTIMASVQCLFLAGKILGVNRCAYISNKPNPILEQAGIKFIQWEQGTFIETLKKFDSAIIMHGEHLRDRMRCTNRLMTTIYAGVVPLIHGATEYAPAAFELGLHHEFLYDTFEGLEKIVKNYADRGQLLGLRKLVWDLYCPRRGGEKLYEVFKQCTNHQ